LTRPTLTRESGQARTWPDPSQAETGQTLSFPRVFEARSRNRTWPKVPSLRAVAGRGERITRRPCADALGVSLHAGARFGAHQRKQLEPLCRTVTRPALANERA